MPSSPQRYWLVVVESWVKVVPSMFRGGDQLDVFAVDGGDLDDVGAGGALAVVVVVLPGGADAVDARVLAAEPTRDDAIAIAAVVW
ncbi:MAG: hypothetical protein IPN01_12100 [Deltaproteobacteria bacterium]|nr:hypothetical protein [Deltaproteobacteria bacterium]